MGRRRGPRRAAPGPALAQRRRRVAHRHRRRRGDLSAGRVRPGPVRPPPRAPDLRRARRGPPRGRVGDAGAPRCARRSTARRTGSRCPARRSGPTRARSRSSATTTSAAARPTSSTATPRRCATTSAARSRSGCWTRRCAGAWTRRRRSRRSPTSSTRPTTRAGCAPRSTRRTPLLPQMLRDADALLLKARAVIPDAAGLVLCDDRAHARATAALLRTISGEKPVVVVSDEPQAHARIDRFARGDAKAPRWLVAVNMVSEGVDVPRLVLAAYATVKRTDLFFRQAVGRVVRRRADDPADLVATVFLPADPTLTACAERVEVELRQQVSDEVGAAFDVEPPPGLARRAGLPAARRPGRARRDDRRRRPLRARRGRRRAAAAARARPVRARAALRARVRPPRARRRPRRHRRRRFPRTGASSTSAARSTGSPAAGRSCGARSIPATRGRRRRRASTARWASAAAPTPARRELDAGLDSCARSSPSSRVTTPSRPSGCASRQRRGHRPAARRGHRRRLILTTSMCTIPCGARGGGDQSGM